MFFTCFEHPRKQVFQPPPDLSLTEPAHIDHLQQLATELLSVSREQSTRSQKAHFSHLKRLLTPAQHAPELYHIIGQQLLRIYVI